MELKHRIFSLIRRIFLVPVSPTEQAIRNINCSQSDIEFRYGKHHLTATNPIRIFNPDGYFRECRKHQNLSEYLQETTKEYFFEIIPLCYADISNPDGGGYNAEYQMIVNILNEQKTNYMKFTSMGSSGNPSSPLMLFHTKHDFDVVGLKCVEGRMPWDVIETFVWYSRSHIDAWNFAKGVNKNSWQTYNAQRGIATYEISKVIGLEGIVPKTSYCRLSIDERRTKFGSFMDLAEGIHYDEYSHYDKDKVLTPKLQRALVNLNILDAITYEKDHRLNNYNIVFGDNGKAIDVCAYDNDAGPTFFISPSPTFSTYAGCSPIIMNGLVNRPHLAKNVAERLLSVKKAEVYNALDGLCNGVQKWACWQRVQAVQKAIKKTSRLNSDFLLDNSQWNESTMREELSGKYGKTYLCLINNSFK